MVSVTSALAQLDSCGLDKNPTLNKYEVEFLDAYYKGFHDSFKFQGKTIAFLRSPGGKIVSDKVQFFNAVKDWNLKDARISTYLIVLTDEEKQNSGGYDAILTHWVKFVSNRQKKRVIKMLGTSSL